MVAENNISWKCYTKSKVGSRHKDRHMLCQDRVAYRAEGDRQAIALVDGIGDSDINIIAGEKITQFLSDFMIEEFDRILEESIRNISYTILVMTQRIISDLMDEYGVGKDKFSSTIMGFCVDNKHNMYCSIHLGDGIMIVNKKEPEILSYPTNGLYSNQTYLTTSDDAFSHIKIRRGKIESATEIALMSDGVYQHPLTENDWEAIIRSAKDNAVEFERGEDDKSVIILSREEY